MSDPLNVRPFELKAHYSFIARWWFEHNKEVLEFSLLPKTGFVAFEGPLPIAACFLLLTNSAVSVIAFIVSNPKVSLRARARGFDAIIKKATEVSQSVGTQYLISVSTSGGASKRLKKRHGFDGWRVHELVSRKLG